MRLGILVVALLLSPWLLVPWAEPRSIPQSPSDTTYVEDAHGQVAPAVVRIGEAAFVFYDPLAPFAYPREGYDSSVAAANFPPAFFAPLEGGNKFETCWTTACVSHCVSTFTKRNESVSARAKRHKKNVDALQKIYPPDPKGACD